jgi:signal transduction histidine kinase
MEAGREEVQPASFDCCAVARDAAALVEPAARARGLHLVCEMPDQLQIHSDESKLRQILINLLGNAVKFTTEGCVTLRVSAWRGNALFEVEDTGIGIAPEDMERIFERFWQVDQGSTRSYGGTGLGLTVSRRLTELLGGRLTVESRLGAGSRFRATIPIAPAGL